MNTLRTRHHWLRRKVRRALLPPATTAREAFLCGHMSDLCEAVIDVSLLIKFDSVIKNPFVRVKKTWKAAKTDICIEKHNHVLTARLN